MPDKEFPQPELTPQHISALETYERKLVTASRTQAQLNTTVDRFAQLMSPSGVPRGLGQLTKGLGDAAAQMRLFQRATGRSTEELRMFASRIGSAVMIGGSFLSVIDTIEKKQGQLQRAYGITNVSMKEYHETLASMARMGGTAAVEAARQMIDVLAAQRSNGELTGEKFRELTETYTKFTLALSQNFPQDFIRMQQELGMTTEDVTAEYEQLGYQAAQARVPFEQYKNTVFDTTSRLVQYGTTVGDVRGAFNLFIDDVSKRTITLGEAANAINKIIDVQQTAAGLQKRAVLAKYVSENWEEIDEALRARLDKMSREEYEGVQGFQELTTVQRQYVLGRVEPETYARAETAVFDILEKRFGKAIMQVISPQLFTGQAREFWRRRAAVETGPAVPEPPEDVMEEYRKSLDQMVEKNKEWYNELTSFVLKLKSLGSDLGIFGKAIGTATVFMGGFALAGGGLMGGRLRGGIGTGAIETLGGGRITRFLAGPMGRVGTLFTRLIGPLALAAVAFKTWSWAIDQINKAGGFQKLADDIIYWEDKIGSLLGFTKSPEVDVTAGVQKGSPEMLYSRAVGLVKLGETELAKKVLKSPTLEEYELPGGGKVDFPIRKDLEKVIRMIEFGREMGGGKSFGLEDIPREKLPETTRSILEIRLGKGLESEWKEGVKKDINIQQRRTGE